MKKCLIFLSTVILIFVIIYIFLENTKPKFYSFETSILVKTNEGDEYKSTTKEFVSIAKKKNLKDNVISSNIYGVKMKLNKMELIKIIISGKMRKLYVSFEEYIKTNEFESTDIYMAS